MRILLSFLIVLTLASSFLATKEKEELGECPEKEGCELPPDEPVKKDLEQIVDEGDAIESQYYEISKGLEDE